MAAEKRLEGTAECAVIGLFGGRSGCCGRCEWDFVQWETAPRVRHGEVPRDTKTAARVCASEGHEECFSAID